MRHVQDRPRGLSRRLSVSFLTCAIVFGCGGSTSDVVTPPPVSLDTPASIEMFVNAPNLLIGQFIEVVSTVKNSAGTVLTTAPVVYTVNNPNVAVASSDGEFSTLAAGTVVVTGKSGKVTSTATVRVDEPPTTNTGAWTFCVAAGNVCDFDGLRIARLGAANGPYVQQPAYHGVPCASFGFGGQDPAPGQAQHCDYGPLLTTVINNPAPGAGVAGSTVGVPMGATGFNVDRIQPTSEQPVVTDGSGSFRTTCDVALFAFDDPIVYPRKPGASHLHIFFGNTKVRAASTAATIASEGPSTCRGGTVNRTGYWAPAIIDSRNGEVQIPETAAFYYKSGYNIDPATVQPFPVGLQMIAGNKLATAAQDNVQWACRDFYTGDFISIPTSCKSTDFVRLSIQFPQCWDGKNLDSPDHKSHMSFPDYRNPPQRSTCPATHPIVLPAITEKFEYPVAGKNPATWRLSSDMYSTSLPGGLSAHADWMNGWKPAIMKLIVTSCINKAVDCGVASLGDGTELY